MLPCTSRVGVRTECEYGNNRVYRDKEPLRARYMRDDSAQTPALGWSELPARTAINPGSCTEPPRAAGRGPNASSRQLSAPRGQNVGSGANGAGSPGRRTV